MRDGDDHNDHELTLVHPIVLHLYQRSIGEKVVNIPTLVVFNREFVFSAVGIESCKPKSTIFNEPNRVEFIGNTEISYALFLDFIFAISDSEFSACKFDLTSRSFGDFVVEVCSFLGDFEVPKYVHNSKAELSLGDLDALGAAGSLVDSQSGERISFARRKPRSEYLNCHYRHLDSQALIETYVPQHTRKSRREDSPDLEDIQKQIEALRVDRQRSLEQSRSKVSPISQDDEEQHGQKHQKKSKARAKSGPKKHFRAVKKVSFVETPVEIIEPDKEVSVANGDISPRENSSSDQLLKVPERDIRELSDSSDILDDQGPFVNKKLSSPGVKCTVNQKSEQSESELVGESRTQVINKIENILKEMSESEQQQQQSASTEPEPGPETGATPKKDQKPREPPITFREFDHIRDFEELVKHIVNLIDEEDQERLREMEDWIVKNEGTWVLSEGFNSFLGRVLHEPSLPSEGRVSMLRLLAFGAGQDDIVLIMHSDRKDHLIMNYAQEFDRLPIREQEATALFFANLFETNSASEWLLYISEWPSKQGKELSNIRVTTKVAVNALLGDTPTLQDYGSAIMHNLGTKEVKAVIFDDICTELAMAILQFFQGKPKEEQVFRCLKALNKFSTISRREVPQLIKMIGPEPDKFMGMSERCDMLIGEISAKLATVAGF